LLKIKNDRPFYFKSKEIIMLENVSRVGSRFEQTLHRGWISWAFIVLSWLAGYLLYAAGLPRWSWEGFWTLFFLYTGSYCVRNFLHCRETHCVITGPGWLVLGILGLLGTLGLLGVEQWEIATGHILWGGWALLWIGYALFAALGYSLQWFIKRRTGRLTLVAQPAPGKN
jgi:hypothetical protein